MRKGGHLWLCILFFGGQALKNYDVRLSSLTQRALDLIALLLIAAFLVFPLIFTLRLPINEQQQVMQLNSIQLENQLPGTTTWQLTNPALYRSGRFADIEGYPWAESAIAGDSLSFSVSTGSQSFTADIYRLGWYNGTGGRLRKSFAFIPGHFFPLPPMDQQTGLVDAHWPVSFTLTIDSSWVTGIYIVKLTAANGKQNYIPFVIRSKQPAALLFVHGDNTDQAYNPWGGKSLYEFNSSNGKRAYKVSFNRPLADQGSPGWGNLFSWEYPMIRYLEKRGYELNYISSVDTYTNADIFKNHAGVLIVGHQEYWTKESRDHLETAIKQGVNLAVFAGDTMGWQIRYEPSQNMQNRIIVCYKDALLDPLTNKDNSHVTVWPGDNRLNRPVQSLLGSMSKGYFHGPGYSWVVVDSSSWIYAGTNLKNGDTLPGLVGYEYDGVYQNYPVPAGLQIVAKSPVDGIGRLHDEADSTLYAAPSGAWIFNASTIQWSAGLDDYGSLTIGLRPVVNPLVQKITENILQKFLSLATITSRLYQTSQPVATPTPSNALPANLSPTPTHEQNSTPASKIA
jgi:hypothetical protein